MGRGREVEAEEDPCAVHKVVCGEGVHDEVVVVLCPLLCPDISEYLIKI